MASSTSFDPCEDVIQRISFARQLFGADVQAMSPELLSATHGGETRCGYDFMYELVGFFDSFGKLLAQGPTSIEGPSGWVRAPKEFHDKESAIRALDAKADSFVGILQNYSGDFIADEFPSPVGPFTPLGMANLAVWHMMYHSGQLNYIQTIHGDAGFHWMPEAQ